MARKKIKLEEVLRKHAVDIVLNGKRAKVGKFNPYRQFTTKYYLWQTGKRNTAYKPSAVWIVDKLIELGYPVV